ncbi:protein required for attachment to host cells [Neorhizobium galegae]|uniref:baeRF12 domain-containing protein n=1 Tax=Neorhizobium galegae TaxID=399 RepID=UPI001AE9130A|nr:host attachment family protein [Neorhizobium galegae]MBP2562454.1 protein required for attachment to host cells [Neorhizobium galegae]
MNGTIIPYNARILVADARKALLLRNTGTAFNLILEVEEVIEAPDNAPAREQGTDRPGRAAMGSYRSSLGQTDFHEQEEDRFVSMVAEKLEAICKEKAIHQLFVVAPPKALADLRRAMPEAVKSRIVAEYDKDLVNLSLGDIQKHLAA